MYRGYIKLWRKIIDGGWLKNHKLWVFWSWCLVKASHKECDLVVGCQQVHLMPGDFVFGLNKASEELDMSVRSIRTIIDFLRNSQNMTIKTTNKYSVISITNWGIYQSEEIQNDNQNDKRPTNDRQQTRMYKNEKNIFIIPTVEQVREYCIQRGNKIDPEKFVAFYESNGWLVGKNKMKKWKAAIITWEKRKGDGNGSGTYIRSRAPYPQKGRGRDDGSRGSGIPKEYKQEDLPALSKEQISKNLERIKDITG